MWEAPRHIYRYSRHLSISIILPFLEIVEKSVTPNIKLIIHLNFLVFSHFFLNCIAS